MKLLLDENISYRAVNKLTDVYPEVSHVKSHNLMEKDDRLVWQFAKNKGYTYISPDLMRT